MHMHTSRKDRDFETLLLPPHAQLADLLIRRSAVQRGCVMVRACTFERAGESSRSKFNVKRNLIVVNKARRDFVFAARGTSSKLRYLVRLYAKQLVMHTFSGLRLQQLLDFPCVDKEDF